MTTEVLVLRHGQSEWNALGRWQGQENPPLTDLGREQAVEAAQAVGTVDAVFASPLDRAARTAGIIAESIGVGPVVEIDGLMERHAGEWQGLTRPEIEQAWPGYLASGRRPPAWEDDQLVEARALGSLLKRSGTRSKAQGIALLQFLLVEMPLAAIKPHLRRGQAPPAQVDSLIGKTVDAFAGDLK